MASSGTSPAMAGVVLKTSGGWNSNLKENPEQKVKQTKGRRKIAIRKIENKNKKHVTFSKRRRGLIKKASELCAMCGASVAVVTCSAAGKVYSFGHPSPDAVFKRYLDGGASSPPLPAEAFASASDFTGDPHSEREGVDDRNLLWWDQPIEELGFDELEAFAAAVEQVRSNVESRIADLDFDRSKAAIAMKNEIEAGMTGEMSNHNYFVPPGFLSLPPPGSDHQYQCGCGCAGPGVVDDGIGRIFATSYNRFSGVFGDF